MRNELNLTIEKLKERTRERSDTINQITIEPQTIYRRTYNSISIDDKTNFLRNTALEAMRTYGTDTTKRMYFTKYHSNSPHEVSYCIAVPPESEGEYICKIPGLKAISFFHHRAYEDIPVAKNSLINYAEKNNIKLSGTFRSIYLEGPPQHKDKNRFITQLIAIIE